MPAGDDRGMRPEMTSAGRPRGARDARCAQTVYKAADGFEGMLRLAGAWHARVMADEVVSHAFSRGLDNDDRLRQVLHDYFAWATTTAMSGYERSADDVPDELSIPHWSWDGLARTDGRNTVPAQSGDRLAPE